MLQGGCHTLPKVAQETAQVLNEVDHHFNEPHSVISKTCPPEPTLTSQPEAEIQAGLEGHSQPSALNPQYRKKSLGQKQIPWVNEGPIIDKPACVGFTFPFCPRDFLEAGVSAARIEGLSFLGVPFAHSVSSSLSLHVADLTVSVFVTSCYTLCLEFTFPRRIYYMV